MNKLFAQVERVEYLKGRADNYFGFDLCGKDTADATAFACTTKRKPQTNADRLRAMSDEELAKWIRDQIIDRNIGIPSETWLDWLRQEAKE